MNLRGGVIRGSTWCGIVMAPSRIQCRFRISYSDIWFIAGWDPIGPDIGAGDTHLAPARGLTVGGRSPILSSVD